MKRLIILLNAAFLIGTVIGQNSKKQSCFLSQVTQKTDLSFPGIHENLFTHHNQGKSAQFIRSVKNAGVLKQRLDSIVSSGTDKESFLYNSNNSLLINTSFEWDGKWINSYKNENSYNQNGQLIQDISYRWDGLQWMNNSKGDYSYHTKGFIEVDINSEWSIELNKWLKSSKDQFFRNSNNQLVQIEHFQGSHDAEDLWFPTGVEKYLYDEKGNMSSTEEFDWSGISWLPIKKSAYTYNAAGNNILTTIYAHIENNWVKDSKIESVFHENGYIKQTVGYSWNLDLELWESESRYDYTYDANWNLTLFDVYFSDFHFLKMESVYDDFGNQTMQSFYALDFETFQLVPNLKQEFIYDNSFSFEDLILPFTPTDFENDDEEFPGTELSMMFKHKLTHLKSFEGVGGNWVLADDYIAYYSDQNVTGVNELNLANRVNVYPSPATSHITFNIDGLAGRLIVELYDIQGKLVLSKMSENNSPVSIEALNKGLYFYKLSENQNSYSGKFVVK